MAGKDARVIRSLYADQTRAVIFAFSVFALATLAQAQTTPGPSAGPRHPAPTTGSANQPKVVAVVNGEQITRQTLAQECLRRYGAEVLETMVNKQIILQACQARGVQVTDKDIEDEIYNVARKFGLSVDRWLTLLETERNVDPDEYRREILWPMLALRRLAAKRIEVTDEEYRQAFESDYGPKVKARIIVVTSRQKADQLRSMAAADPDSFNQLAKEHSEDRATASAYGAIPPIRMHVGDPDLEKVAFSLKEGEISPVLQIGNQYIILKCEQQIPRTYISSQQLPQIEQQLRQRIRDHKMRLQSADMFQQLQAQAQVTKVYSDPNLQQQYPGVAAIVNGRQITTLALSEQCLLQHGREVLDGEINRTLLTQELRRQNKVVEQRDLDAEIARAADAYGYLKPDGSPDIDGWLKAVTENDDTSVELYVRDAVWPSVALKQLVDHTVEVTQEDLQKGFESNFGERVEVLAIVMSNQRQAESVWEMARNNPTDQFFGELAHQYSIEPSSRANFGKVPPIRKYGGQPLVEKEAFKLKPGELSGIIAVGENYIILRCLGRTKPVVTEFEVVKDELMKDIREKKLRLAMAQEFDRLKEGAQIDNFLAGTTQNGRRLAVPAATPATYNQPVMATPGGATIQR